MSGVYASERFSFTHSREGLLGKAADVGEETGEGSLQPDGIMAQASWERLAEVTSGRSSSQQGLAATCKDHGK